jgi:hypothetical protein
MVAQAAGYNVSCWAFTRYMTDREKWNVQTLAKVHNVALSVFSGVIAVWVLVVAVHDGRFDSHDAFHCHPTISADYYDIGYVFYLSKLWEMIDTFLLIATKKKGYLVASATPLIDAFGGRCAVPRRHGLHNCGHVR